MIATAVELRKASEMSRVSRQEKSKEELVKSWVKHFEKTVDRAIKDAVRAGAEVCSIQLPWQPERSEEGKKAFVSESKVDGVLLRTWVKKQLPGCDVNYVEEELEGLFWYMMEISWSLKQNAQSIREKEEENQDGI